MNIQPRTLKDGTVVWRLEVTAGRDPATGRYRRVVKTVGPFPGARDHGRKRAEEEWLRLKAEVERRAALHVQPSRERLADYLRGWLDEKGRDLAPSTAALYRRRIESIVIPALGDVPLDKLSPAMIHEWLQGVARTGRARLANQARAVLHTALEQAYKLGMIAQNPVARTDPVREERRAREALSPEQLKAVLAAAPDRMRPLFLFAAVTGLRRGEVLGLHWEDVDFEARTVRIRRTLVEVEGQALLQQRTKTEAGVRTIHLPGAAVGAFRRTRAIQLREQQPETGFVFTGPDGQPLQPKSVTRAFARAAKKAGLQGVSFHSLRHTADSLLLAAGVPPVVAMKLMGHKRPSMTVDLYGHLLPEESKKAAERIDRYLGALVF